MLFKLYPFSEPPQPLDLQVQMEIFQDQDKSFLRGVFFLESSLSLESIEKWESSLNPYGSRCQNLWQSTCFEFFMASTPPLTSPAPYPVLENSHYWEFNLSPDGNWNFYFLKDYRCDLQEAVEIQAPPLLHKNLQNHMGQLQFTLNLTSLFEKYPALRFDFKMACSAVIQWKKGGSSYFALKHPKTTPDFHHPEGFVLNYHNQFILRK